MSCHISALRGDFGLDLDLQLDDAMIAAAAAAAFTAKSVVVVVDLATAGRGDQLDFFVLGVPPPPGQDVESIRIIVINWITSCSTKYGMRQIINNNNLTQSPSQAMYASRRTEASKINPYPAERPVQR